MENEKKENEIDKINEEELKKIETKNENEQNKEEIKDEIREENNEEKKEEDEDSLSDKYILTKQKLNKDMYIIKIGESKSTKKIVFHAEEEFDISPIYYECALTLEEVKKVGRSFSHCNDITGVISTFQNYIKYCSENENFTIKLTKLKKSNILKLNFKTKLYSDEKEIFVIELIRVNKNLENYTKQLYSILKKHFKKCEYLKKEYEEKNFEPIQLDIYKKLICSNIITNITDLKFIEKEIKFTNYIKYNLIFDSEKNGDTSKEFHKICDKYNKLLVVIKTKKNVIFGGYTSLNFSGKNEDKIDNDAFCFNLNSKKIYKAKENQYSIGADPNIGPIFIGKEIDEENDKSCHCFIIINDKFLQNKSYTTSKDNTLNFYPIEKDFELNEGRNSFKIDKLEIFNIVTG